MYDRRFPSISGRSTLAPKCKRGLRINGRNFSLSQTSPLAAASICDVPILIYPSTKSPRDESARMHSRDCVLVEYRADDREQQFVVFHPFLVILSENGKGMSPPPRCTPSYGVRKWQMCTYDKIDVETMSKGARTPRHANCLVVETKRDATGDSPPSVSLCLEVSIERQAWKILPTHFAEAVTTTTTTTTEGSQCLEFSKSENKPRGYIAYCV